MAEKVAELEMNLVVGGQTYATYETADEYEYGYKNRLNIGTCKFNGSRLPLKIKVDVTEVE